MAARNAIKTFSGLCSHLQDPCHVARFQQLCGVQGTFSAKKLPKDADGEPLLSSSSSNNASEIEQQEERDVRQRRSARQEDISSEAEATTTTATGNGTAVSAAAAGEQSPQAGAASSDDAARRAAKPLRKNSLTGDVGQEFIIHNRFLFYLFTFGTELGNEMFFIVFFPFVFWNVDALVSRRLIIVWAWNLFIGQSTKDLVRWSRPASPPVVKVEVFYNSEYSMPSTHAMTGTAIPFSLFLLSYGRWQYPFLFGLCVAGCWSFLVCVSRVYMGMHSILEVITGFLYTLLILAFFQPILDQIDNFYMTSHYAPLVIVVIHVSFGLVAFSLDSWSTSRGDTAQALGTGVGVALGTHVHYQLGLLVDPALSALPLTFPTITTTLVLRSVLRFLIGVAVLLVTRMVMKALTIPFLCHVCGLPSGDVRQARQHMKVELPYRYIVYSVVGFNCVCLGPALFSILNLS